MTRRAVVWIVALAFAGGMLVTLPASLLEAPANAAMAPYLRLAATGTIWRGSGTLTGARSFAVPLTWRFSPLSLFRLRAAWQVTADASALKGSLGIGADLGTIEFRHVDLDMDVAMWAALHPAADLFRPAGRIRIDSASLVVGHGGSVRSDGDARVRLDNLILANIAERAIGSYLVTAKGSDRGINFKVGESSGSVTLDGGGSITMAAPREVSYTGEARVAAGAPEAIRNLFAGAGEALPDGRIRIDQKARW
jgi:hypothetical protein